MKTKLFLTILGSCAVSIAYSQIGSDQDFSNWDANNNNRIEKNEYKLNSNLFDKWDEDKDNKLSQREIGNEVYKLVDADSDGKIDSIEWNQAMLLVNANKDGNVNVKVSDWDTDRDTKVSKEEFDNNLNSAFKKWDSNSDNGLSKTEFYNYSFGIMDLNNDGFIAETEFNSIKEKTRDNEPFWKEWFE